MSTKEKLKSLEIGLLQMQILWLLGHNPSHGYELMKKLSKIKRKKITQGTLYPTLKKLLELELIEVKKDVILNRKVYNLTENGKTTMIKKCEEFCKIFEDIFDHFSCKECVATTKGIVFKERKKNTDVCPVCGK